MPALPSSSFEVIFQSTLPARGATAGAVSICRCCIFQSTLPARGATRHFRRRMSTGCISIHAPRTGSDPMPEWRLDEIAWISIHAPRTGSDANDHVYLSKDGISIHAPRTGSDNARESFHPGGLKFQSTLPARGATLLPPYNARRRGISIHAPRTGSDVQNHSFPRRADHFNPRSPHGERPEYVDEDGNIRKRFQSTLPARGAT